ncbi:MAG: hypothetical protein ACW981_14390 [Candidatus Hodarchaeales archaeon]
MFKIYLSGMKKSLRRNKLFKTHRGISPIIATLLILGLVTTGVVIGLFQILPFIERSRIESGLTATQTGLIELDNTIHELIIGGGGFKNVEIDKPLGILSLLPGEDTYFFRGLNTVNGSPLFNQASFFNDSNGIIEFETPADYDIIPVGEFKFLSGPSPYTSRDEVVFLDQTSQTISEYSSMNIINMTRSPASIQIDYFYRPKVVVSQTGLNIDIQIQFIKLKWSSGLDEAGFLAVENTNNQIGVRYSINPSNSIIFNGTLAPTDRISIDYQNTGADSDLPSNWNTIWNSANDASNLVIRLVTHEVELVEYV